MGVSAQNLFNRSYHKVPRHLTVFAKITAAADVQANGYTIDLGKDFLASVTRSAEGIMVVTTKMPWKQLIGCEIMPDTLSLARPRYTSNSSSGQTVTFTWEQEANKTTDTDPDGTVFWLRLDFNIGSVAMV